MAVAGERVLVAMLLEEEAFIPHAYQDSLGFWTIGIGRLIDKRKGGGITIGEGLYLLRNDIADKTADLDAALPWWQTLDAVRQSVLLDLCFNLGIEGLKKFTNTLASIKAGNYALAAKGMRASLWAKQVGNRAERLAQMMETGRQINKWW